MFHDWFRKREDFDGCSFINVLIELGATHPAGQASIQYLDNIRSIVRQRAETAGLRDPDSFARSWHILMKGSIISAAERPRGRAPRPGHGPHPHRTTPTTSRQLKPVYSCIITC